MNRKCPLCGKPAWEQAVDQTAAVLELESHKQERLGKHAIEGIPDEFEKITVCATGSSDGADAYVHVTRDGEYLERER